VVGQEVLLGARYGSGEDLGLLASDDRVVPAVPDIHRDANRLQADAPPKRFQPQVVCGAAPSLTDASVLIAWMTPRTSARWTACSSAGDICGRSFSIRPGSRLRSRAVLAIHTRKIHGALAAMVYSHRSCLPQVRRTPGKSEGAVLLTAATRRTRPASAVRPGSA
jgi:hypothetical protein